MSTMVVRADERASRRLSLTSGTPDAPKPRRVIGARRSDRIAGLIYPDATSDRTYVRPAKGAQGYSRKLAYPNSRNVIPEDTILPMK